LASGRRATKFDHDQMTMLTRTIGLEALACRARQQGRRANGYAGERLVNTGHQVDMQILE